MLGWMVVITMQSDADHVYVDRRASILASWTTSFSGIDWLTGLVSESLATQTKFSGYPNLFFARAQHILPLLENGTAAHPKSEIFGDDDVTPVNFTGDVHIYRERIAACSGDEMLRIEVWDQS